MDRSKRAGPIERPVDDNEGPLLPSHRARCTSEEATFIRPTDHHHIAYPGIDIGSHADLSAVE